MRLSAIRDFLRRDHGSVTVEYVLWLPVLMAFIGLSADASFLFVTQQSMTNAARDIARQVAVGEVSIDDANEVFLSRLDSSKDFETDVSITDGFVSASVSVPFADVTAISGFFTDLRLTSDVTMWVEQAPEDEEEEEDEDE